MYRIVNNVHDVLILYATTENISTLTFTLTYTIRGRSHTLYVPDYIEFLQSHRD